MYKNEQIKNSVIIIALDNLIQLCNEILDIPELTKEDIEWYQSLIDISRAIIYEKKDSVNKPITLERPKWKTK